MHIDRNGNEIFGGDIVSTKYGRLCIIIFFESQSYHGLDMVPVGTRKNIAKKEPDAFDLWNSKNLEIVGNIHDNPELLQEDK